MEYEEKIIEESEVREETDETLGQKEESKISQWFAKIGEKNLIDAFSFVGKIKLKYIAYALGIVLMGLFLYYIGWKLIICVIFPLVIQIIQQSFFMATGIDIDHEYHFFDSDLWYSIPVCLTVSIVFAKCTRFRRGFWLFYFAILIFTLEYWDYIHENCLNEQHSAVLGGVCFGIFFVLVPVLLWINHSIEKKKRKCRNSIKNKLLIQSNK
jgi:hypothetical protein